MVYVCPSCQEKTGWRTVSKCQTRPAIHERRFHYPAFLFPYFCTPSYCNTRTTTRVGRNTLSFWHELHIIVCLSTIPSGIRLAWWSDKSRHVLCPCNVRPHTHALPKTQPIDRLSFDHPPLSHSHLSFFRLGFVFFAFRDSTDLGLIVEWDEPDAFKPPADANTVEQTPATTRKSKTQPSKRAEKTTQAEESEAKWKIPQRQSSPVSQSSDDESGDEYVDEGVAAAGTKNKRRVRQANFILSGRVGSWGRRFILHRTH